MGSKKRTAITNGIRPWRYLVGIWCLLTLTSLFSTWPINTTTSLSFSISATLFTLLYYSRRIVFSSTHLFKIHGNKEQAIPFTSIQSIKRNGAKVNGTRMWIVTHLNTEGKEKKVRFLEGVFQHGSTKEFIQEVRKVNADVVVWEHPHFNH